MTTDDTDSKTVPGPTVPPDQFGLLGSRRFLPLFVTQFLGAFNDNAFENGLVILIAYVVAARSGMNAQVMVPAVAVGGWLTSRLIPSTRPANPALAVDHNFVRQTWRMMGHAAGRREILLPILGLSWFWFVGATYMSQVAPSAKDHLGGDEHRAGAPPR